MIPKFDNLIYATIEKGDFLGLMDLIPTKKEIKDSQIELSTKRKFTCQCLTEWSEFLTLTLDDFEII